MSSAASPSLTAWQRWEMAPFGGAAREQPPPAAPPAAAPPALQPLEALRLVDDAELQRVREQARREGLAEGWAQGHAEGFAKGSIEGRHAGMAEVREQALALLALARSLPAAMHGAGDDLAHDLLDLGLELGRQMAGRALREEPELLLPVVRGLLAAEPALSGAPRLLLQPDDAALVQEHLGTELQAAGWTVQAEPGLERGGCIVRAASGELDATVQTRRQRVEAALAAGLPPAGAPDA